MLKSAVYHAGALGDFLSILPFLEGLKSGEPKSSISLLSRRSHMEFAKQCGLIDESWDIESPSLSFLFTSPKSEDFIRSFDRAFCIAAESNPVIGSFQSTEVETFTQPPFPSDGTHVIDYHLQLLKLSRIPITETKYRMPLTMKPRSNCVFLHPGSGSARKNWPSAKFRKLASMILYDGYEIAWICGPGEREFHSRGDAVYRNCRLFDLARHLGTGAMYVGNDSGISHLASISGTPTLVLFGASDPRIWAPRGPMVRIIKSQKCHSGPCHPAPSPSTCSSVCMDAISVEEVFEECRKLLQQ